MLMNQDMNGNDQAREDYLPARGYNMVPNSMTQLLTEGIRKVPVNLMVDEPHAQLINQTYESGSVVPGANDKESDHDNSDNEGEQQEDQKVEKTKQKLVKLDLGGFDRTETQYFRKDSSCPVNIQLENQ